jgi:member of the syntaxin family of t-SNAREs
MAASLPDDPFLSVQSDVISTLNTTRTLFSSFLRIRTLATTRPQSHASEELASARKELEANLETLQGDIADLEESIRAVEGDPYAFGIDAIEVQRRRGFVREVGGEVEGMRHELGGGGGGGAGNVAATSGRLPGPAEFDEDGGHGERDGYEEFEVQQQQQMMREQEQDMEGVFRSVGVLRGQAVDMGRELEEQGGMLDEVDTLADRVGGKLQTGVKKVGEVIRKNEDGLSSCGIAVLIVVLIILLIMVIVI